MIALITPTGLRPQQIELCAHFMGRQTFQGKVVWIIVDDGNPVSIDFIQDNFRENWEIFKVFPYPTWSPGFCTQSRNISAGIEALLVNYSISEIEAIFIIEDDDYYSPQYLETVFGYLQGYDAAGECCTVYYNVANRQVFTHPNSLHASLFQTAFSPKVLKVFIKSYDSFIDLKFWGNLSGYKTNLVNSTYSIGIKGIPGRGGIGAGHRFCPGSPQDLNFSRLQEYLKEDYIFYTKFSEDLSSRESPTKSRINSTLETQVKPVSLKPRFPTQSQTVFRNIRRKR